MGDYKTDELKDELRNLLKYVSCFITIQYTLYYLLDLIIQGMFVIERAIKKNMFTVYTAVK